MGDGRPHRHQRCGRRCQGAGPGLLVGLGGGALGQAAQVLSAQAVLIVPGYGSGMAGSPRSVWQDVGNYPSGLGRIPVPVRFQLVIDCADPARLAQFWAAALGYEHAPVPDGFATLNDFYREPGVPEEELVDGADRISDPEGRGPSIWFHVVPDAKVVKNRLHLDNSRWRAGCPETGTSGSGGGHREKDQPRWHLARWPTSPPSPLLPRPAAGPAKINTLIQDDRLAGSALGQAAIEPPGGY